MQDLLRRRAEARERIRGVMAAGRQIERAFIPHVGWLWHDFGDELVALLRQGYFEAEEQAFMWLFLRPEDWVLDCGAHIGLYSVLASRATAGRAHVLAVEASAATAELLDSNLAENGVDGRVVRGAVWRARGTIRFVAEGAGRSAYGHVAFAEAEATDEVEAVTLDALVDGSNLRHVAIVKLDLEGAEPEAFEGAKNSLASGTCPLFMVEFTEANLQRRGLTTAQLGQVLAEHGLTVCQFDPARLQITPCSTAEPIWFRNLFAARDPEGVNARLRTAVDAHVEVARDILARAAACSRFKELEELDRFRQLAASNEQWARNSEALLARERELSANNERWARRTEELLARERELTAELERRVQGASAPGEGGKQR